MKMVVCEILQSTLYPSRFVKRWHQYVHVHVLLGETLNQTVWMSMYRLSADPKLSSACMPGKKAWTGPGAEKAWRFLVIRRAATGVALARCGTYRANYRCLILI